MKAKITLRHKETNQELVLYNEIFDKSTGVAFFELNKKDYDLVDFKPLAFSHKGIDYFEGDKVIVKGTKRIGEYETEIIKSIQGWTLKENKTYLNDDKCFISIISKID